MVAKLLGLVGRALLAVGVLVLLFVVYQLWGTGIQEARSQRSLEREFQELRAAVPQGTESVVAADVTPSPTGGTGLREVSEPPANLPLPREGDPAASIRIPSIGVTRTVVEGITVAQLRRGPGHYPETPLPGQQGNVAIAGHRTTYGQPFHNIDKLANGDEISFETLQGDFTYVVTETHIVEPSQVEVLEDFGDNRVTLIACEPKYSAAQRIIVVGTLVEDPAPPIDGQQEAQALAAETSQELPAETIDEGLTGTTASAAPALIWGLVAGGVWIVAWLVSRLVRRRISPPATNNHMRQPWAIRALGSVPYLVGLPAFLVALYFCFEGIGRLLPAAY